MSGSLNFFNSELSANNLGCMGPEPYYNSRTGREICGLRYKNIGTFEGTSIDLFIQNTTAYHPNNAERNGINGQFGQINLLNDRKTYFRFCFLNASVDRITAYVPLTEVTMTFYDFDRPGNVYAATSPHTRRERVSPLEYTCPLTRARPSRCCCNRPISTRSSSSTPRSTRRRPPPTTRR